jgi:hypothetical protein
MLPGMKIVEAVLTPNVLSNANSCSAGQEMEHPNDGLLAYYMI